MKDCPGTIWMQDEKRQHMSVILETKHLCKFYGAGENQVKAVNQVDIQIERGEFVAIVGK